MRVEFEILDCRLLCIPHVHTYILFVFDCSAWRAIRCIWAIWASSDTLDLITTTNSSILSTCKITVFFVCLYRVLATSAALFGHGRIGCCASWD